ncbi:MAG TPA: recombination protein RecR [Bacteroidetes bacterium]|jgi:recombination protein RecR|nr:MAG: recombination protein RecR [Sphingobacteriales bacterium BACL12 MAG-120802-bin5]KRP11946.1 MAG: recombination protein RecR [Sphingobacteriales bacterium BACL12 MAG-120813-bin55]HCK21099.1 recombination protein RecR [Bacteroidota bacterium]
MKLPSTVMENAVNSFARLPGIGKKTALRLVLHMMKQDKDVVQGFSESMLRLKDSIHYCVKCHNISEAELCSICSSGSRNKQLICVVAGLRDLLAIENTQQYNGTYHIIGGVISPVEGIGPEALQIDSLLNRLKNEDVNELIMALNPTIEGDTTSFYIAGQVKRSHPEMKISTIARGVAFGGDLEYTDEITLARSLAARLPYRINKEDEW